MTTTENKYTPHVHAEAIKAWADGKRIQGRRHESDQWEVIDPPSWSRRFQYRVKPEEVVTYAVVLHPGVVAASFAADIDTLVQRGWYSDQADIIQGYCKRTTIDGKVVSLEFIPK